MHQRGEKKKSHKKNLRYLETNENEKIKKIKKKKRKWENTKTYAMHQKQCWGNNL